MRPALVAVVGVLTLAGGAGLETSDTRSAAQALTAAGFQARPADTPEKRAQLAALTPRKVLWRPQDGQNRYVYADPTRCKCLYVGGEEQYQRLRQNEQAAESRFFAVEGSGHTMDWGLWEIGSR